MDKSIYKLRAKSYRGSFWVVVLPLFKFKFLLPLFGSYAINQVLLKARRCYYIEGNISGVVG